MLMYCANSVKFQIFVDDSTKALFNVKKVGRLILYFLMCICNIILKHLITFKDGRTLERQSFHQIVSFGNM